MAGFSLTNGVKRRRILPVATGNRWVGLVILFDLEKLEPVAIMPDGVIQKMRVAALSAVGVNFSFIRACPARTLLHTLAWESP